MSKKYSFYAQASCGYVIKGIFEILLECLTTDVPLCIKESGISSCCMDKEKNKLIDLNLPMSNFDKKYKCMKERKISVHLKTFCKLIKNVKKKDSLALFLENDDSNDLGIQIMPTSTNNEDNSDGKETSMMKIHDVICPNIIIPVGYYYPKSIKSVSYQKMCKKMAAFGQKVVHVTMQKNFYLQFKGTTDIISACVECGNIEEDEETALYEANFSIDSLAQFIKMSTLSPNIQVYSPKNSAQLPLKIESHTSLGIFRAFIKTEEQIIAEKDARCSKERK